MGEFLGFSALSMIYEDAVSEMEDYYEEDRQSIYNAVPLCELDEKYIEYDDFGNIMYIDLYSYREARCENL